MLLPLTLSGFQPTALTGTIFLTFFNSKVNGPMGRYGFDIIATSISGHRATLSTPLLQTNTQAFLETLVRHW